MCLLAYCFAVSPAYGIERFRDDKGVIHISNIPSKKDVKPKKPETAPKVPIPNPVQATKPPVLSPEPVAALGGPPLDPALSTPRNIPGTTSAPSSIPLASPPPAITTNEASPNARGKPEKGQTEKEAIAGSHQGELGTPRGKAETMRPRGSQVLEINIPQTEGEANQAITFATFFHSSIVCSCDSRGVLHIKTRAIHEPNDLAGLRPDDWVGKSQETWSQESAEDHLLAISLESREDQLERTPGRNPTESNRPRSETPKYIRMYQDYRSIIHIQNIDQEKHFPYTVST
jgi:hypothetical protein